MEADKYSQFDDGTGLPTHHKDGKELNQNQKSTCAKFQKKQETKYQKWLAEQSGEKADGKKGKEDKKAKKGKQEQKPASAESDQPKPE